MPSWVPEIQTGQTGLKITNTIMLDSTKFDNSVLKGLVSIKPRDHRNSHWKNDDHLMYTMERLTRALYDKVFTRAAFRDDLSALGVNPKYMKSQAKDYHIKRLYRHAVKEWAISNYNLIKTSPSRAEIPYACQLLQDNCLENYSSNYGKRRLAVGQPTTTGVVTGSDAPNPASLTEFSFLMIVPILCLIYLLFRRFSARPRNNRTVKLEEIVIDPTGSSERLTELPFRFSD